METAGPAICQRPAPSLMSVSNPRRTAQTCVAAMSAVSVSVPAPPSSEVASPLEIRAVEQRQLIVAVEHVDRAETVDVARDREVVGAGREPRAPSTFSVAPALTVAVCASTPCGRLHVEQARLHEDGVEGRGGETGDMQRSAPSLVSVSKPLTPPSVAIVARIRGQRVVTRAACKRVARPLRFAPSSS